MNRATDVLVASPCRDICRLDGAGVCVGCGRLLSEIAEWSQAGPERRQQICSAARQRVAALEAAERGEFLDRNPR